METLHEFLAAETDGALLPWRMQIAAASRFGTTLAAVERAALEAGIIPSRYQRNMTTISARNQLDLFNSEVAIIGCGGLGGYVVEQLARLGVGRLMVVDPDVFEEHNLNRQLLSTVSALGSPKVTAAWQRVAEINPAVTVIPVQEPFGKENGSRLLQGCRVAVDALDSIAVRLELAEVCREEGIPLVHGAIAGWYGHVATQLPGERSIETIYRDWKAGKSAEQRWGNPPFTPAVVASIQTSEVCKLLLDRGEPLRCRELSVDLLSMEFHCIEL